MHHFFTLFSNLLVYNYIMNNNIFNKEKFNNYLINNDLSEAYKYLLKTNNLDLLLCYKRKFNKFKIKKLDDFKLGNILVRIRKIYYQKITNFLCDKTAEEDFKKLVSEIKEIDNIYYFIKEQDIIIFKNIDFVFLKIRVLEGIYELKINIISNFVFKGWLHYISLGKLSIKTFIFNNELYITKSTYNKNVNSKKFKLFLISQAQYIYDLKRHNYNDEEKEERAKKLVILYQNNEF